MIDLIDENYMAFFLMGYVALYGTWQEKTCLRGLQTTETQTSRLISAFIRFLESIISKLATSGISIF